ncbi:MAG: amidohydrolase family protein, partial [Bacteroidia bacterium]|nr:amidohydrolase family protein [Bacteroidia bacterium]
MKIRYFFPLLLLVLSSCTDKDVFFENAQCYTDVNVIDAEQGIRENMTVVVHNGRIARISPSEELILSSNNNIIDGSGKYMIPGLWDAHVHFSYLEELAPIMFNLFLAYGVTSVRDTGGDINFTSMWRARAKSNPEDAPRVMIAGPLLDGSPNVYDGSSPSRPKLSVEIKSRQDALITTDMYIESGVDFIKAYEMLSPEEFITVCNVANGAGLKVTGHVPLSMDVIAASNAGLNSMEHLRNLEMSCATNSEELLQDRIQLLEAGKDDQGGVLRSRIHGAQRIKAIENQDDQRTDEVLTVLRKNQTWQIPTLALISGFVERPFLSEDWQKSIDLLP